MSHLEHRTLVAGGHPETDDLFKQEVEEEVEEVSQLATHALSLSWNWNHRHRS